MKTYFKVIIGAILVGGLFAYFFYRDIKEEVVAITTKNQKVSLFQVGVFKSEENAINFQNNFTTSIIYKDNEGYFRVLIGVAYHEENVIKLETFYTNQGIEYYIKEIKMNEDFTNELASYESVMLKTNKEEVINNINNSMLNLFLSYI